MFTYPIALNPTTYGGAAVSKSFDIIDRLTHGTVSAVSTEATTTPHTLTISHQPKVKVKGVTVDRHLVKLRKEYTDPVVGEVFQEWYMVGVVPRGTTVVTLQEIKDMVGRLIALEQSAGALDRILANEP